MRATPAYKGCQRPPDTKATAQSDDFSRIQFATPNPFGTLTLQSTRASRDVKAADAATTAESLYWSRRQPRGRRLHSLDGDSYKRIGRNALVANEAAKRNASRLGTWDEAEPNTVPPPALVVPFARIAAAERILRPGEYADVDTLHMNRERKAG